MHWALDPVWKICNFLWIRCCASISAERWGLQPKSCNHLDPENQAVLTGANVFMKIVPFTFTFIWSIIPYTFTFSITPSVLNVQCAVLHSKRSGKNCQIQSPFSSVSLKSKEDLDIVLPSRHLWHPLFGPWWSLGGRTPICSSLGSASQCPVYHAGYVPCGLFGA